MYKGMSVSKPSSKKYPHTTIQMAMYSFIEEDKILRMHSNYFLTTNNNKLTRETSSWSNFTFVLDAFSIDGMICFRYKKRLHFAKIELEGEYLEISVFLNPDNIDEPFLMMKIFKDKLSEIQGIFPYQTDEFEIYQIPNRGRYVLDIADKINAIFAVKISTLIDFSSKEFCPGTTVLLGDLFLLSRGVTWFNRHGFITRGCSWDEALDPINDEECIQKADEYQQIIASVRATCIANVFIDEIPQTIYTLAKEQLNLNPDSVERLKVGDFMELLERLLFQGNQAACHVTTMILEQIKIAVQEYYNIDITDRYDVYKVYRRDGAHIPQGYRIQRQGLRPS
jgi:hypothetical protein